MDKQQANIFIVPVELLLTMWGQQRTPVLHCNHVVRIIRLKKLPLKIYTSSCTSRAPSPNNSLST